ncbi:MAG: hypothetical protein IPI49_19870 [Myxococcales bacterium]|nr:hypothetical protein [Myxococcales bacterium]
MKVKALQSILATCDPEAEVLCLFQPVAPREQELLGLAIRHDCLQVHPDKADGRRANDVLLLTGRVLRSGDRNAWDSARLPGERRKR